MNIFRHKSKLAELTWADVYDGDFPMLMTVIEILGCIPPTSVVRNDLFTHEARKNQ